MVPHVVNIWARWASPRGFYSIETALLDVTDRVLGAMDEGDVSLLCIIDLSKCFNVINHAKLLTKLQLHCIDTTWFAEFLSGHSQSVRLTNSNISSSRPIIQGVFHGSSLGPLLFIFFFANDLSLHANGTSVVQYADDTQVLVSDKKSVVPALVDDIEASLASFDSYFRANGLKVN